MRISRHTSNHLDNTMEVEVETFANLSVDVEIVDATYLVRLDQIYVDEDAIYDAVEEKLAEAGVSQMPF
jgi:hypothetical protein